MVLSHIRDTLTLHLLDSDCDEVVTITAKYFYNDLVTRSYNNKTVATQ
jgi:hypothetical protein